MDILFYNFRMDSIEILWYCTFMMINFLTQIHNSQNHNIALPMLCDAFRDVITKPKNPKRSFYSHKIQTQ
jgi:hypothetical protein